AQARARSGPGLRSPALNARLSSRRFPCRRPAPLAVVLKIRRGLRKQTLVDGRFRKGLRPGQPNQAEPHSRQGEARREDDRNAPPAATLAGVLRFNRTLLVNSGGEIGRASCREWASSTGVARALCRK